MSSFRLNHSKLPVHLKRLGRHSLILTVTQHWYALDYKSPVNKKSLQLPHQQSDNLQYRSLLNIVKCILSMYSPFQIWSLYVIAGSQLAMPIYIGALLINCWKICYTPQKRKIFTTCKGCHCTHIAVTSHQVKMFGDFYVFFLVHTEWRLNLAWLMMRSWVRVHFCKIMLLATQIIPMNEMTSLSKLLFFNHCNF